MKALLASYGKSGNTWMRLMLAHYFLEKDELTWSADDRIWITKNKNDMFPPHPLYPNISDDFSFIKTHSPLVGSKLLNAESFDMESIVGAVVLTRNPFDVVVSYHHFSNKTTFENPLDERAYQLRKGLAPQQTGKYQLPHIEQTVIDTCRRWNNFHDTWLDYDKKIVFKYEDMLIDPAKVLRDVLIFCGFTPNEDRVTYAVEASSLTNLRDMENTIDPYRKPGYSFFRAGAFKTYHDELTTEQIDEIHSKCVVNLERFGYETDIAFWQTKPANS